MDFSELSSLAKALTKDEFIARFPNLFLPARSAAGGRVALQFRTEIASPSARDRSSLASCRSSQS